MKTNSLPALTRGVLDPVLHGIGLVADCETCHLAPRRHGRVTVALLPFAFERSSGRVLGALPGLEAGIEPDLWHRFDLRRFHAVLRDVEFVITPDGPADAAFLGLLLPGLAALPCLGLLRVIPWRAFGYAHPTLPCLLEVHGLAQEDGTATTLQVLQLLAHPSPAGPTYLELLLQGRREVAGAS